MAPTCVGWCLVTHVVFVAWFVVGNWEIYGNLGNYSNLQNQKIEIFVRFVTV